MKEKAGGTRKINKHKRDVQIIKIFKYEKLKKEKKKKQVTNLHIFTAVQCFCYSPKFKITDAHTRSIHQQRNLNGVNYR